MVGKYDKNNFVIITVTPAPVQMTKKKVGLYRLSFITVTPAPVQMTKKKWDYTVCPLHSDSCSGSNDEKIIGIILSVLITETRAPVQITKK